MKISLTLAEIKAMVAREYVLPDAFDLEIVDAGEATENADGWISNVGRDKAGYPETLSPETRIEVKYREGFTTTGWASEWNVGWCEASRDDSYDIVAYRVIK